jgi:hypothetical protein
VGQTRNCPNCSHPVVIVAEAGPPPETIPVDEAGPPEPIFPEVAEPLPGPHLLERLDRESHYLVCNRSYLVATWANNGSGWMLKTNVGMIPARRNRDQLPSEGDFHLIELKFALLPEGKRLVGLNAYRLAPRWALSGMDVTDDAICEKITGPSGLNKDQKNVVRQALREHFMRPVWENAAAVLEYLANADYHSSSIR